MTVSPASSRRSLEMKTNRITVTCWFHFRLALDTISDKQPVGYDAQLTGQLNKQDNL